MLALPAESVIFPQQEIRLSSIFWLWKSFQRNLFHNLIREKREISPTSKESFIYVLFLISWSVADAYHSITCTVLLSSTTRSPLAYQLPQDGVACTPSAPLHRAWLFLTFTDALSWRASFFLFPSSICAGKIWFWLLHKQKLVFVLHLECRNEE